MFKRASLTPHQRAIIVDKGTEIPVFDQGGRVESGTYVCRQCGLALFRACHRFHAGCGWPSFDHAIEGRVQRQLDADGRRVEIVCQRCQGHLGHVFEGEGLTSANVRYCLNALSLEWVMDDAVLDSQEAIFAGGCFWGLEYWFKRLPGVLVTQVGYTGGDSMDPDYGSVCEGQGQHLEAIRVVFDPTRITYEQVAQYFFEIHDPTQSEGQGPDIGGQYLSAVFCYDDSQRRTIEALIGRLQRLGYAVVTQIYQVKIFWPAENYHQNYYAKVAQHPYCHRYIKRF